MELYRDEIKLFPKGKFIPYVGYGDSKSNITILLYKLIGLRCPLYNDEVGCTIYEDRPIICKRFPFSGDPRNSEHGLGLDNGCRNAPKGEDAKSVSGKDMDIMWPILKQVDEETKYMTEKYHTSKLWIYKNFKWRLLTQKKLDRLLNRR
jgi:Fe-S-cluster containining protein